MVKPKFEPIHMPPPGQPPPSPPIPCVMVKLSDVKLAIIGHYQTGSIPLSEIEPIADSIIERIPKG